MRKSAYIKRFIALLLVVLMSINTFAAVVGDNDGAAFITKAEFDSMKNDFQSQLDRYNSSLDNKIDGAIASYLAGINIQKQEDLVNYYEDFIKQNCVDYRDIKWSSTATRECESIRLIQLYKDLTSAVYGRTAAVYDSATAGHVMYSLNAFLFGDFNFVGTELKVPERFQAGFDGWLTSRWLLTGTFIGNTINEGWTVDATRDMAGFFDEYNNRGMGTNLYYHYEGANITNDWKYGAVYGNGLVASIGKIYFDKATSSYSSNKPNTKEYVFAPWAATTFSYEDFTNSAYSWGAPKKETWTFKATSARLHELVNSLPTNAFSSAVHFNVTANNIKQLILNTFTLNNLNIMDWVTKYGWAGDIKAGVPLSVAPSDGSLEIEYTASSNGWLVAFNPISASDYTWGGKRLNASDNSSFKIDKFAVSTTSHSIKIENMKKGLICFMFVPDSTTDQFINITKVSYYRD